jgi:hypothetical protein
VQPGLAADVTSGGASRGVHPAGTRIDVPAAHAREVDHQAFVGDGVAGDRARFSCQAAEVPA